MDESDERCGVDEELIAAQVGAEQLYLFIKASAEADGYHFDPDATLGALMASDLFESERVKAVRELFVHGFRGQSGHEHIQEEMWMVPAERLATTAGQAILSRWADRDML